MTDTKHIDLIQATIGRLAGHGFLVKGWSVTLATAALGLAVKEGAAPLALTGVLPTAVFWVIDAYYLALEGAFRTLHDAAVESYRRAEPPTFAMTPARVGGVAIVGALIRPAVALVHAPLIVALVLAWALLRH